MAVSTELANELRRYLEFAESNGKVHADEFSKHYGLCTNLSWQLRPELGDLLERDFGNKRFYPFGGPCRYYAQRETGTYHRDPDRLAWVRKILAEAGQ